MTYPELVTTENDAFVTYLDVTVIEFVIHAHTQKNDFSGLLRGVDSAEFIKRCLVCQRILNNKSLWGQVVGSTIVYQNKEEIYTITRIKP